MRPDQARAACDEIGVSLNLHGGDYPFKAPNWSEVERPRAQPR